METTLTIGQLKAIRRKYDRNEANNDHNDNALLLVMAFGTKEEEEIIDSIIERTKKLGFTDSPDVKLRLETSNKYFHVLCNLIK
jgi:hypothetical protein